MREGVLAPGHAVGSGVAGGEDVPQHLDAAGRRRWSQQEEKEEGGGDDDGAADMEHVGQTERERQKTAVGKRKTLLE